MNLIPMKDSDYAAYLTNAIFEYANDKVQAGTWAKDEALALAKESFASLLPQGTATENNHLRPARKRLWHQSVTGFRKVGDPARHH